MKNHLPRLAIVLWLFSLLLAGTCPAAAPVTSVGPGETPALSAADGAVPALVLPIPASEGERSYLGLSGTGTFSIGQIAAEVLLIEVFSFYCPLCQMAAAHVNELYEKIEQDPRLRGRVKLIGIGVTNTAYEVGAYKDRYKVPFPLFPDKDVAMTSQLGVRGTPTFIGLRLNDGGKHQRFHFSEGGFADPQQFLDGIVKRSGLKQEVQR